MKRGSKVKPNPKKLCQRIRVNRNSEKTNSEGCFFNFFWCAPFGYLYFSYFRMNQDLVQELILAWFNPYPSSILDEMRFEPTNF